MSSDISILHAITKMAVGGSQMNTLISCREMLSRGYRSGIVTGPDNPEEGMLLNLAREWGIPVHLAPHLRRSISPFCDFLAGLEVRRTLLREEYTILHTHSAKVRVLGRLFANHNTGAKIVQTAHGWPFYSSMSPLRRKVYIALEKLGFGLADATVVVTFRDRDKAVAAGIGKPGDFRVIRSGVEFGPFLEQRGNSTSSREMLGIDPDRPVVGSVMRICNQKAPDHFVSTAARVLQQKPNTLFLVVGDGPHRLKMESMIASHGLEDGFLLLGSRTDVHRILPAMDVFLLTSRHEGLPRALLEALAVGVPAVATDVGGVTELLDGERNGLIYEYGDIEGLAGGAIDLLENPARGRALLSNVDRDLEAFSARRMVDDLQALYNELGATG
ncbi:glycosyltransferase [Candidatus Fermentibacteria bacterium]|nr:glycosyltransferase [Candidatus Fermentibacteria bacterium]